MEFFNLLWSKIWHLLIDFQQSSDKIGRRWICLKRGIDYNNESNSYQLISKPICESFKFLQVEFELSLHITISWFHLGGVPCWKAEEDINCNFVLNWIILSCLPRCLWSINRNLFRGEICSALKTIRKIYSYLNYRCRKFCEAF